LLPRSTIRAASSFVGNRVADLFDLIDAVVDFVARLFTPRRVGRGETGS
jgi:hypothetical protein